MLLFSVLSPVTRGIPLDYLCLAFPFPKFAECCYIFMECDFIVRIDI